MGVRFDPASTIQNEEGLIFGAKKREGFWGKTGLPGSMSCATIKLNADETCLRILLAEILSGQGGAFCSKLFGFTGFFMLSTVVGKVVCN